MSNTSIPPWLTPPPILIPALPQPDNSRNFPEKKYWGISKDPDYSFDEVDQDNDILKKVVLDEIGKYRSLWRTKSHEAEKESWSKVAVATFKRTGYLLSFSSMLQVYRNFKDNLRNRLKFAIMKPNWSTVEIERHLWTWDYYPHIRFYRELTQEYEQTVWSQRQWKVTGEVKVRQPTLMENDLGVVVEYPEDDDIIWDPPPPPQKNLPVVPPVPQQAPPSQQTPAPQPAAPPQQASTSQQVNQPSQQAPMQPRNGNQNSRKRSGQATAETREQAPQEKKPTPMRQSPPKQRNNANQAPTRNNKESPPEPRVPPPLLPQHTHFIGPDGMVYPIPGRVQQPTVPPHFNQPVAHSAFGSQPHPAFAPQGHPPFPNFPPPVQNGHQISNQQLQALRFNPNPEPQYHPHDIRHPMHPMHNAHLAALQQMSQNRANQEVQRPPNHPGPKVQQQKPPNRQPPTNMPSTSQPVQDSQLSSSRPERSPQTRPAMNGQEPVDRRQQITNQPNAGNSQQREPVEPRSTQVPASVLATFEKEVEQIAFQAIRTARENPDCIRILRKVLFDAVFAVDGKKFDSPKDVYKELYNKC